MVDWEVSQEVTEIAKASVIQRHNRLAHTYGSSNAPWDNPIPSDNLMELETTRIHLEEAQQSNANLHSELNSLRQAFAQMQSELSNLRPSASTSTEQ